LGAEVALATLLGAASFALVAVVLAVAGSVVLAAALGVICVAAIVAITRFWGIAYAAPAALAILLAYDWFEFPPTHPRAFPGSGDLADLLIYLAGALLLGELAAHAGRRADVSEVARDELAEEQSALRRVATLVARGVPPPEVFAAVAREIGRLLDVDATHMASYDAEGAAIGIASWSREGDQIPVGTRVPLEGESVAGLVFRTGRPGRMQRYDNVSGAVAALGRGLGLRSSVGAPIFVDQHLWGVMIASSKQEHPLPADTESRIAAFTELVATAISNTEARAEVRRLADEQAALRRVATLVARESSPDEIFTAVAEELARLLIADVTTMFRFEDDGTATIVASGGERIAHLPVGATVTLDGENVPSLVHRTARPVRLGDYAQATGSIAAQMRTLGVRSAAGAPIVVSGRVWGAVTAASCQAAPLAAGAEWRIGEFAELVATAISNIEAWSDLAASRARIVAATDEERRRVVRDLHDGAQQRLVHTVVTLKLASRRLGAGGGPAHELVDEALDQAQRATDELRELAHGILPAVLSHGGLRAGVDALASRMPIPVSMDVPAQRFPAAAEATAYFLVAEALTNVAKHAQAQRASVTIVVRESRLEVQVRDDGIGGAVADGSGLLGLEDRLASLGGALAVQSPPGGGTLIAAWIPLPESTGRVADRPHRDDPTLRNGRRTGAGGTTGAA
jgi:signal transduction histidine kinase